MGKILVTQDEIDTGTRKVREPSHWQQATLKQSHAFGIKQGIRRRHPKETLSRFQAITGQTEKAESLWEKAFQEEEERPQLDKQYKWNNKDTSLMTNQMGVVTAALDSFKRSRGKLERTTIVGV
jgi:hypothetical protein